MRFTNKFPYTNINNINLDWIIKRVKELGETVRSYANDIANAVALAEAAQDAADSVTGTAESAVATAQAAETTANAIAGTANSALSTAQAANTTAQAAEATANAIAGTANSALSTAQAANTTAQAANATAQAAEDSADNAATIAGAASANASNAVQTANTALATAQSALTIASQFDAAALNEKAGSLITSDSGAIVSFVPDSTIKNLLGVSVDIEPVQAGSGVPSPDNIRPISGWSECKVWRTGKNLFNFTNYSDWADGYLKADGTPSGTTYFPAYDKTTPFIDIVGGETFTFSYVFSGALPSGGGASNNLCFYDANKNFVGSRQSVNGVTYITATAPENAKYVRVSLRTYEPLANNFQLEHGTVATSYETFTGNYYNIELGQTIYGGTLDVTAGKMYSRPYFPSYNGQALIGPWVSSMDAYTPGATPTVGAQVVDMGGAVTEIAFNPATISAIAGQTNNVWADAGDVSVEFAADLKWYIDKEIAEVQALALENGG